MLLELAVAVASLAQMAAVAGTQFQAEQMAAALVAVSVQQVAAALALTWAVHLACRLCHRQVGIPCCKFPAVAVAVVLRRALQVMAQRQLTVAAAVAVVQPAAERLELALEAETALSQSWSTFNGQMCGHYC